MDQIVLILANPIVSLIGYVVSIVSGIIAIAQYKGKSKVEEKASKLEAEILILRKEIDNHNQVKQGDKSQYFQENSGPVNIDNRG